MIYSLTDQPEGRWTWEKIPNCNISNFVNQGVRLFQTDLFFDYMWFEDGMFDITSAVRQLSGILDICPDVAIS